jgi:TetR/AcrR family transcriptional regulator
VTTGAVAAEVGVPQAAIFQHFPTKSEMWVGVADYVAGLLIPAWVEALEEAKPPVERLKSLVGAQLDQITARTAMPMLLFSRELSVENAVLRAAFRDRLARLHGLLTREVALLHKSHEGFIS